ncbi:hypothetical protein TPY_1078 [Sulfobacillus acidophilus TPY]|nr:hypothetical protein TPY_1078 [Sulfobacillus acidophilus TPY]
MIWLVPLSPGASCTPFRRRGHLARIFPQATTDVATSGDQEA